MYLSVKSVFRTTGLGEGLGIGVAVGVAVGLLVGLAVGAGVGVTFTWHAVRLRASSRERATFCIVYTCFRSVKDRRQAFQKSNSATSDLILFHDSLFHPRIETRSPPQAWSGEGSRNSCPPFGIRPTGYDSALRAPCSALQGERISCF
ncbi:MAG: hypothetical protein CVV27_00985 [Candidatus Melainabacteria bacterium HGW-Melainabacteria-1]|nr:MAG: hypothetical protein CVV27_00985 [Candidatus Melainabacteria bacterium HGW-Melainabacteria-1]